MNHSIKKNLASATLSVAMLVAMLLHPCGMKAQEKSVITFDVGSSSLTLLSEGQGQGRPGILIGATEEMMKQTMPTGTFANATNAFLVEAGGKTILFDAGYGRNLFDNLEQHGKKPADIDAVILTHMHGDHIGGLLRDGQKSFPNATLYIPRPEHDYWMSDEAMQSLPENRRGGFLGARKVIDAYTDKLQLFAPGEIDAPAELLPGIGSVAAYGHTPGHTGYMLESDGEKLFIWGDLTHAMAIQMPYPEVAVTYDVDPEMATQSRLRVLAWLADNKVQFAGMHVQYPGAGIVRKHAGHGYSLTLLCECEGR